MITYVYSKVGAANLTQPVSITLGLTETITSATVGSTTPTTGAPTVTVASTSSTLTATFSGGSIVAPNQTTYGTPLTVVTNLATYSFMLVCVIQPSSFVQNAYQAPQSYQDLLGKMQLGQSALSTVVFSLAADVNTTGSSIIWELVDSSSVVWSSGNCYVANSTSNGANQTIVANAVVTAPQTLPITPGSPYQIRYTLTLPNSAILYSYEVVWIESSVASTGAEDAIELFGDPVSLACVTDNAYSNVTLNIYNNTDVLVANTLPTSPVQVENGWLYSAVLQTQPILPPSFIPYTVVWGYSNSGGPTFRQTSTLYITTPTMLSCMDDLKARVNKANQTLWGVADSQYKPTELLRYLRMGGDYFNGAYGVFTSFTFTQAAGPIREYLLQCATIQALEAQYLLEGEKAFNFQGASIQLDVDKTQALDSAIGRIQQQLDNGLKQLKVNLTYKGVLGGTGAVGSNLAAQVGQIGAVGQTVGPASPYWSYGGIR